MKEETLILGIESSCDDTSAAVVRDGVLLSNVTANQDVHRAYGGVVPELASRAHQQNIVPVVDQVLRQAGVEREALNAIAFTRGPGLMGSLLVGTSFAKGMAAALDIPLIDVNHLHGHVMALFVKEKDQVDEVDLHSMETKSGGQVHPTFPFLCLLVSGGNSQIVLVRAFNDMEIIGQTIDDAAGEALDKCSKIMGLGYPGGPVIDRLARQGDPHAFTFSKPHVEGYDYSFSGLKTSFLYSLRRWVAEEPDFMERRKCDLAASMEKAVVDTLMDKLQLAARDLKISRVALAGGVSANTLLRETLRLFARKHHWDIFIPPFSFTTDNAAMIATAGYYKYLDHDFCPMSSPAYSRVTMK